MTAPAFQKAGRIGLTGEERTRYAIDKAHLRSKITDRSFYRILKTGKELCAAEKAAKTRTSRSS
jgi:hypothetical protein